VARRDNPSARIGAGRREAPIAGEMVVLRGLAGCPAAEFDGLKTHLLASNVPWVVTRVIERGAAVQKAEVAPLSEVGNLRTIFVNLKSVRSQAEYGEKTFLVSQVMGVLRCPEVPDLAMLNRVSSFIRQLEGRLFRRTVTLLETDGDFYIVDGNKSAVASFEHASLIGDTGFRLPVYVVKPGIPMAVIAGFYDASPSP
jgi:hypothetical protein